MGIIFFFGSEASFTVNDDALERLDDALTQLEEARNRLSEDVAYALQLPFEHSEVSAWTDDPESELPIPNAPPRPTVQTKSADKILPYYGVEVSDGVIVGSAVVQEMIDGSSPEKVGELVATFRNSLDKNC